MKLWLKITITIILFIALLVVIQGIIHEVRYPTEVITQTMP